MSLARDSGQHSMELRCVDHVVVSTRGDDKYMGISQMC
jgi:hypothetical protein